MNDTRNVKGVRGMNNRNTDIAALGKDDIWCKLLQKFVGLLIAADDPERIGKVLRVKIPAKLSGFNGNIGDVIIGNQLFLNAADGSDVGDFISGVTQVRNQGQIGSTMTGGSASGQYNFLAHE